MTGQRAAQPSKKPPSTALVSRALALALTLALTLAPLPSLFAAAPNGPVTLTIESWRYDDLPVWRDHLIPAFERAHPGIKVKFAPTPPADYDRVLSGKLSANTAGDLITCRPFDVSLQLYQKGRLLALQGLAGMSNFSVAARTAWSTDDGSATFCVPIAAVIHGFLYNADAFKRLGVKPPATVDEFFQALEKIKADGAYIPLAMGTKDGWETASMGYQNIGPTYYRGEEGRKALIAGAAKLTDAPWVEPLRVLAKWRPFLGVGFEAQTYPDSQNLFTLGQAAVYPAGSWEVADFGKDARFKLAAFPPPVQKAGDKCYISDHPDIALGVNAKSPNAAQAKVFLEWVASNEFAGLYSNLLPGFFTLSNSAVEIKNPLAREFSGWRGRCESTIRPSYQILSRGTPSLESEFWIVGAAVMNGSMTPEAGAQRLQAALQRVPKR